MKGHGRPTVIPARSAYDTRGQKCLKRGGIFWRGHQWKESSQPTITQVMSKLAFRIGGKRPLSELLRAQLA